MSTFRWSSYKFIYIRIILTLHSTRIEDIIRAEMFRHHLTSFITVTFSLASISITLPLAQATNVLAVPKNTSCVKKFTVSERRPPPEPGKCMSLLGSTLVNKQAANKQVDKPVTILKIFRCPVEEYLCMNATWSGRLFVRTQDNREIIFGNISFTSTDSSPTTLTGISTLKPWPLSSDLWIHSGTGDIYMFSNASFSDPKCYITLCVLRKNAHIPVQRANFAFGVTDENLITPTSTRTVDNGTIAAIVLVSAIVVGLIILAALYRRRGFDRFK
ncbi:m12 protein [Murid betaherpesvirus 1]|uniref:M12 protein n=1 Tax=Murid herpesvirus 1 TaxID=10366 RepID=H2A169_MUHV1|nr:m12 protein [Murid betaherpesvirus 1]